MASLLFKPQFLNFPEPGVLSVTFSFKLAQHSVPCLVLPASLFGYWCSSLFLFLDQKQCVLSGCGLPILGFPTEPHRQEGFNGNHMLV